MTTENPGQPAQVSATLLAGTLHFSFSIPRGEVGAQGATGNPGADGGIGPVGPVGPPFTSFVVDGVTTLDPAQLATVSAVFDGTNVRLAFGIPRGQVGAEGPQGITGATGATGPAFTSFVAGSVTTLDPFSPATVTATFDGTNIVLAFGIPRGFQGNDGPPGAPGPQDLSGTSNNSNSVAQLAGPFADPEVEALRAKVNELIAALRR